MKTKYGFLTLLFALWVAPLWAQPPAPGQRDDQIQAMKIAFITRKLSLTPDEAKLFWPVYDQYQGEAKAVRTQMRMERIEARENFDDMDDKTVSETLDRMMDLRRQEMELDFKYKEEFKKVLPIKKVAMLYVAEMQFKKLLLDQLNNRPNRPGAPNPPPPGGKPGPQAPKDPPPPPQD